MTLIVGRETPEQPDVLAFLHQADARSASLYPIESRLGPPVALLLVSDVRFFVARRDGRALGCGGFMRLDGDAAEVKRLFVDPAVRGGGIGRAIMQVIEATARTEEIRTLLLETGVKSSEALGLYRSLGFTECGPFAAHNPDPLSVFMAKPLV